MSRNPSRKTSGHDDATRSERQRDGLVGFHVMSCARRGSLRCSRGVVALLPWMARSDRRSIVTPIRSAAPHHGRQTACVGALLNHADADEAPKLPSAIGKKSPGRRAPWPRATGRCLLGILLARYTRASNTTVRRGKSGAVSTIARMSSQAHVDSFSQARRHWELAAYTCTKSRHARGAVSRSLPALRCEPPSLFQLGYQLR